MGRDNRVVLAARVVIGAAAIVVVTVVTAVLSLSENAPPIADERVFIVSSNDMCNVSLSSGKVKLVS